MYIKDITDIYIDGKKVGNGEFEDVYYENTELKVSFGDVEGYYAPEDRNETVRAYEGISIEGIYQRIQNGTIYVVTTSDDDEIKGDRGDIFIDYEKVGTGTCRLEYPENTNHTISFGDVGDAIEGYYTPESVSVVIQPDKENLTEGVYRKVPKGTICIETITEDGDRLRIVH